VEKAQRTEAKSIWFAGICDRLLVKIQYWYNSYELGEVAATREYCDEITGKIYPKPTVYAVRLPWKLTELDHLSRIVMILRPNTPLSEEIAGLRNIWAKGIMAPSGERILTLIFRKEQVKELLDLLMQAKTSKEVKKVDDVIKEQQEQGKDLFEV
jgi:hypothetical protein